LAILSGVFAGEAPPELLIWRRPVALMLRRANRVLRGGEFAQLGQRLFVFASTRRRFGSDDVLERGHRNGDAVNVAEGATAGEVGVSRDPGRVEGLSRSVAGVTSMSSVRRMAPCCCAANPPIST